ncbi:MAG: hypothetical protein ACRDL5_12050 [Solirubrobacteraceae bacterium]
MRIPSPQSSRLAGAGAIVALALAVAVAGCGGSNNNTSTSGSGSSGFKSAVHDAYAYSACMRSHGVTSFADPHIVSGPGHQGIGFRVDPSITGSPAFKSAQKACAHLMPAGPSPQQQQAQGQAQRAGLVSFAACVRSHGFPRFPDPTSQGQLQLSAVTAAGINVYAPATKAALLTCAPASHGQITRAEIEQGTSRAAQSGGSQSSGGG